MTHGHLSLDLTCSLNSNSDYDKKRRAAECDACESVVAYSVYYHRNYCDYAEEDRAHERYLAKYFSDVLSSRSAGTDTRDRTAVLLNVVCNFLRIE